MQFKSWRDYYLFVKEFAKYSCLNCEYGGDDEVGDDESDVVYSNHFCKYWVAMVRWDLQGFICQHWKSDIDGKGLPDDKDEEMFTLNEHIFKKLQKGNRKWSIEEIKELL